MGNKNNSDESSDLSTDKEIEFNIPNTNESQKIDDLISEVRASTSRQHYRSQSPEKYRHRRCVESDISSESRSRLGPGHT